MKLRQANKILKSVDVKYTWKQILVAVKTRYRYLHLPKVKLYNTGSLTEQRVRILTRTFYRSQDES